MPRRPPVRMPGCDAPWLVPYCRLITPALSAFIYGENKALLETKAGVGGGWGERLSEGDRERERKRVRVRERERGDERNRAKADDEG